MSLLRVCSPSEFVDPCRLAFESIRAPGRPQFEIERWPHAIISLSFAPAPLISENESQISILNNRYLVAPTSSMHILQSLLYNEESWIVTGTRMVSLVSLEPSSRTLH